MIAALGLKARTGRAIVVALAGTTDAPRVVERAGMPLLPAGDFAPYHAAEGLAPAAAEQSVRRAIDAAHRLAADGIGAAVERLQGLGLTVRSCGVLVGPGMPEWSTAQILAVHIRMHQAEGELFRNVLAAGSRARKLQTLTLPERTALDSAAQSLGWSRTRLDKAIAALGKTAGAPWGKDQKEASAAALVALGESRSD